MRMIIGDAIAGRIVGQGRRHRSDDDDGGDGRESGRPRQIQLAERAIQSVGTQH